MYFPNKAIPGTKEKTNLSIALLGNRILADQTLMEYLIEFLLVFYSAKEKNGSGRMQFHTREQIEEGKLPFYVDANVALRRFVFYERSKQDSRSMMDTQANEKMKQLLYDEAEAKDDVDLIHDLLLSYAVVTRNRGWYAQALMPVAPEFLLPDLQGIKNRQKAKDFSIEDSKLIDYGFDFDKHNFLARGGQVLYLHLLQSMADNPELDRKYRARLEALLKNMLMCSGEGISTLASYVQEEWQNSRIDDNKDEIYQPKAFNMGFIRKEYAERSERFLKEITGFLSNDIHPITRIELLAEGIVLSLLRVIHIVAAKRLNPNCHEPLWIMDMSHLGGTSNIARLSASTCSDALEVFQTALTKICEENGTTEEERFSAIQKGKKHSGDVFKKLAKEIKLIIPPRGDNERFSLSEPLVRYLVLALVPPKQKITLDTFLDKLYDHFRIVIGPDQYHRAVAEMQITELRDMADYFKMNMQEFQDFLKRCGFLRDLSDATAIVENPYQEVTLE